MAFTGYKLTVPGFPDQLVPLSTPTGVDATQVATIIDGSTVMTGSSSGLSIASVGPVSQVGTAVTNAMSPYAVASTDTRLDCATSGGAISIVLPTAASSTNRVIQVVDTAGSAGTNNITVTVSGGGTINGSASYVVNSAYGTATFVSTGAFWVVTDKIAAAGGGGGYATGVRQIVGSYSGTFNSTSTQLPADNTIPQNTEGAQFFTLSVTPQSATSTLLIIAYIAVTTPSNIATVSAALFQDSATNAFASTAHAATNVNAATPMLIITSVASSSTSPRTYRLRAGMNVAGTLYVNGYAGPSTYFGGTALSGITAIEYGV